ncbi:MAG: DUF3152 domain-containing protein [bacterium]|nr:DUF3152 domain-containing protein [bacterium]
MVVGLDPQEEPPLSDPAPTTIATRDPITAQPAQPAQRPTVLPNDPCSEHLADFCVEVPTPAPTRPEIVRACTTGSDHGPRGTLDVIAGMATDIPDNAVRIRVEVENGLALDGECFAAAAMEVLTDERGWSEVNNVSFVQVDDDSYDLRLILASPVTTDSLCYPARTAGKYSCRRGNRVVINLMRWQSGTDEYIGELNTYRRYLINHEVGHFLGKGHLSCPAPGEPAPVMMQQTKGLGECLPNGWPTKDEH